MRLLKTRRQKVDHVEFGPNAGLLAHGRDYAVYWADPTTDENPFALSGRYIWGAAFTGLGNQLAVSNSSGLFLVHPEDDRRAQVLGGEERGYAITPAGGGRLLLHTDRRPMLALDAKPDGNVRQLWSLPWDNHPTRPIRMTTVDRFIHFEFRGWGTPISPYRIVIRDTSTAATVREWPIQTLSLEQSAVSPDERWFAILSSNSVVVLDIDNQRVNSAHLLKSADQKHFTGLTFHPSGRFLAATSNDATVKLYDTSNWSLATTYTWDIGRMRSVAFSPDGLIAAAGSDTGKVVVWDVDV